MKFVKTKLDILAGDITLGLDILAGVAVFLLSVSEHLPKCPKFSLNKGITAPWKKTLTFSLRRRLKKNLIFFQNVSRTHSIDTVKDLFHRKQKNLANPN